MRLNASRPLTGLLFLVVTSATLGGCAYIGPPPDMLGDAASMQRDAGSPPPSHGMDTIASPVPSTTK